MFTTYYNEKTLSSYGNVYLLQYGSYINKNVMEENIKKLDNYISYEDDGKYYVFLGMYTNLENAKKVSKIFEDKNIYTFIKNDYIDNNEIINKITNLEKNITEEEDANKIDEINNKILDEVESIVY